MRIKQIVLERKSEPSVRELAMTVVEQAWDGGGGPEWVCAWVVPCV